MTEELEVTSQIIEALEKSDEDFDVDESASLRFVTVEDMSDLPKWASHSKLQRFFHEKMKPWHDTHEDVGRGLDYALSVNGGPGGFLVLAGLGDRLVGGVTIMHTGMGGYVPENLLLFICVHPALRGCGVGKQLISRAVDECDGAMKLHVEPNNPARRLYERCGFEPKYVEMRLSR